MAKNLNFVNVNLKHNIQHYFSIEIMCAKSWISHCPSYSVIDCLMTV